MCADIQHFQRKKEIKVAAIIFRLRLDEVDAIGESFGRRSEGRPAIAEFCHTLHDGLGIAASTGRLRSFDFSWDLTNQYTFWSGTIAALFLFHRLNTGSAVQALEAAGSSIHGLLRRTAEAGSREIQLIAAQDEFVAPTTRFHAVPV
jgi:hypothetical protein